MVLGGPVSADLVMGGNQAGDLQIHSQVEGARVYFDTLYKGIISNGSLTVPVNATDPKFDTIVLEYTGYQTYIGPFPKLIPGKTVSAEIEMNTTGYDNVGIIRFETTPPGVDIALNGVSSGVTPDSGVLMMYTVPTKLYHKVDFTRKGSKPQTQIIYVSSNAMTTFRLDMQPATTGDVSFNSNPAGASVYVDNRNVGITPVLIPNISIGTHPILMRMEKYQDWQGEVSVQGGGVDLVEGVLVSLPDTPVSCPPANESTTYRPEITQEPVTQPEERTGTATANVLHIEVIIAVILILCLITGGGYLISQKWKKKQEPK